MKRYAFATEPGVRREEPVAAQQVPKQEPQATGAKPQIAKPRGCILCHSQNLKVTPRGQLDGVSCLEEGCGWASQIPASWGWSIQPPSA